MEAIPAFPCRASVNSAPFGNVRTGLTFSEKCEEPSGVNEPLLACLRTLRRATEAGIAVTVLNRMLGHPKSVCTA